MYSPCSRPLPRHRIRRRLLPRLLLPRLLLPRLLLVFLPASAFAETPPLVLEVMEQDIPRAEQRCAYSRTRIDDDHSRRELYQPNSPGYPWSLQEVNGRPPTEAELRDYAEDQDDRHRRHPLAFSLRSMVADDGWKLRSETADEAVFEFRLRPNEDLDKHLVDKVLGTLVVDKARGQPLSVSIVNTQAAYVAPFVRIASYSQNLSFRWDEALGQAVLEQRETRWRGRAFGLKTIRKHEVVRYGDYSCAGATADLRTAG